MIERISELPWASFESQLIQKCKDYAFKDHISMVPEGYGYNYWKTLTLNDAETAYTMADPTYSLQQQILFNAIALNDELGRAGVSDELFNTADMYTDKDVFFWDDVVNYVDENTRETIFPHQGFEPIPKGRYAQLQDPYLFKENPTFTNPTYSGDDDVEDPTLLTNLPKTHAARSLIEVSEYYGPNNPESKHSNYVSRKVSMLWFFNVVKAIAKAIRVFPWMKIGVKERAESCPHPEAENNPDLLESPFGSHTFKRSKKPEKDGRLTVYGNVELNGNVTTLHSQARFHNSVTMWDKLSVYGQSFFSQDINGTAMRVRWGDLAEYYQADADYSPGTLVTFGGKNEVTLAIGNACAVVTSNPGLVLNDEMKLKTDAPEHPVALALVGRVPIRVWGTCKKFDALVADPEHPGWARVQIFDSENIVARALEDKDEYDDLVLCVTKFRL